jgi:hypothetical protein
VVVRSEGLFDILRPNDRALPVYAAKATAVLQRNGFNVLGELLMGIDANQTRLKRDTPDSIPQRVPGNPYQLGFNIAFQARL